MEGKLQKKNHIGTICSTGRHTPVVSCCSSLCVGVFICGVCFIIVCFLFLLFLLPREGRISFFLDYGFSWISSNIFYVFTNFLNFDCVVHVHYIVIYTLLQGT